MCGRGEAYYVMELHENVPVEWVSIRKRKKKSCFKQNQNVPHENVFVVQLAAVQRTWSPAALFNDQIQLGEIRDGGVARWWLLLCFLCKEDFKMLRFPTVPKMRLDLLFFIQLFL